VGLLSLTAHTSAVALSDFTPKTTNLPAQCNQVYCATIPGCTVADFQNSVCSKSCLAGLVQINALVANNCQSADVEETSIIGLFKLGKAIQVLCNVAVVTTTTGLGASSIPLMSMPTSRSIGTSTMVLSSTKPVTTGLMTDSSTTKSATSASIKQSTTLSTTRQTSSSSSSINKSPPATSQPSQAQSTSASKTSTSPAEAQSIKSGNTRSGGGSPFDNINNSGAASLQSIAQFACGVLASVVLGSFLALI
jgi:hypothetical protein